MPQQPHRDKRKYWTKYFSKVPTWLNQFDALYGHNNQSHDQISHCQREDQHIGWSVELFEVSDGNDHQQVQKQSKYWYCRNEYVHKKCTRLQVLHFWYKTNCYSESSIGLYHCPYLSLPQIDILAIAQYRVDSVLQSENYSKSVQGCVSVWPPGACHWHDSILYLQKEYRPPIQNEIWLFNFWPTYYLNIHRPD